MSGDNLLNNLRGMASPTAEVAADRIETLEVEVVRLRALADAYCAEVDQCHAEAVTLQAEIVSLRAALAGAQKALIEVGADVAQANKDRAQAIKATNAMGTELREAKADFSRLEDIHREMCGRLQAEVEKRHLGLGGEFFDALIIGALEAAERELAALKALETDEGKAVKEPMGLSENVIVTGKQRVWDKTRCERCHGAGWLWGHEIDDPDWDGSADDTRYTCRACGGSGKTPVAPTPEG